MAVTPKGNNLRATDARIQTLITIAIIIINRYKF